MYCTKCGALIDENSDECEKCGEFIKDIIIRKQKEIQHFEENEKRAVKKMTAHIINQNLCW